MRGEKEEIVDNSARGRLVRRQEDTAVVVEMVMTNRASHGNSSSLLTRASVPGAVLSI